VNTSPAEDVNKKFFKLKCDLLRQAGVQVATKELTLLQFYVLWRVYDDIWYDNRRQFISAARLAPRVGFQLRATREALAVLERHRYLRCLRRGGGRELANEYEIGDGPAVKISGINADNVVELQTRYTQNTMHLDASFMPETVHGDAPFRGKNSARRRTKTVHLDVHHHSEDNHSKKRRVP
jgi:hypothetical protein